MDKKFKGSVDKLYERLEKEGKVITLSDAEIQAIDEHIRKDMEEFRAEMYRRGSIPVRPIILSS